MNAHDRKLADIEIARCIASLRQITASTDELHLLDTIYSGLNKTIGEVVDKRYDVKRANRAKNGLQPANA
jgi:hypothetical protein